MKKHFIIRSGDENAGFTAYIKFALNGILHAEQHDLIPVNFDNSTRNFFTKNLTEKILGIIILNPLQKYHTQT